MANKDYVNKQLQRFLEDGSITKRDLIALISDEDRVDEEKVRMFIILEPTIADKLSPHSLSVYYWLKSFGGFDEIDFSLEQICNMTGIKSKKKVIACLKALESVVAIKIHRSKKEVNIINMVDSAAASIYDKNKDYCDYRKNFLSLRSNIVKLDDNIERKPNIKRSKTKS